jgi:hypothetical protein
MRTRITGVVAAVLLVAVAGGPVRTYGTSYDPLPLGGEGTAPAGATVYLFHSGTEGVRRSLAVGEVLEVTRTEEGSPSRTAGKIRVVAAAGAFCVRGEVLEGGARVHDVAVRESVYCLIVPEAVCGR